MVKWFKIAGLEYVRIKKCYIKLRTKKAVLWKVLLMPMAIRNSSLLMNNSTMIKTTFYIVTTKEKAERSEKKIMISKNTFKYNLIQTKNH